LSGKIVAAGLAKRYGRVWAVRDLSFEVEPGRVTGFVGPNGAGKTTTLRMILGLVRPTAGTATIGGVPYERLARPLHAVGAVLEPGGGAHPDRSGRNHLRVLCVTAGIAVRRADEVLDRVGLAGAGDRRVRGYSLGMRQRLSIAQALLGDPGVLVLDEPANGLDPEGIRWLRTLLRELAGDGRTVLVSSHLLAEMQLLADAVVVVAGGELIVQGTVAEVVDGVQGGPRVIARSARPEALAQALAAAGGTVALAGPDTVTVTGMDASRVGDVAAAAGIALAELSTERPDLEQAFLGLTATAEVAR
jgi:ABC-2 type transport system ATP-binding protein